jgi:endoglucanase
MRKSHPAGAPLLAVRIAWVAPAGIVLSSAALSNVAFVGCGGETRSAGPATVAPSPATAGSAAPSASAAPPPSITVDALTRALQPISVAPSAHNLIKNASFDSPKTLPWLTSFTAPASGDARVEGGAFCLDLENAGKNAWDAQFRHREMTIQKGHAYGVRFKIGATAPTELEVKVAMSGPPYKAYWHQAMNVGPAPQVFQAAFTMNGDDDPTAELAFHVGGKHAAEHTPLSICVDDVVLEDPAFAPRPDAAPPPIPKVLVSQVGYAPDLEHVAVVRSDAPAPLGWELLDRGGAVVASGKTQAMGPDAASGDAVHWADFSAFRKPGDGYTLRVAGDVSHGFELRPSIYKKLKYDALAYFYQTRSGIPIAMPYAGDPARARAAGHLADKSVPCAPDAQCDYSLDVSGGWYDAGDHGKYVISGGISTWTLLDLYERTKLLGASVGDFADGKMNIPENHNGAPDLLDEARWEITFLLEMQVPEGKPLAGMVHHKIHDREWTALATRPDQDAIPRFLRPVSTAATLHVAAVGAQCARIWKAIDPAFGARCLVAAERAWAAAAANPSRLAPGSDSVGGGAYEDGDVSDEFYWAASELYVTTKKDAYRTFLEKSPHRLSVPSSTGDQATVMTWAATQALGTISLAVVPNGLPAAEVGEARAAIVKAAEAFQAIEATQGYRVGFKPSASGYPWGSNSFVLNNAIVEALAFDFTKNRKFADSVGSAMGYILGENPNDQSYVTGYGSRPLANPHHRFWAHQANQAFPTAPPGVLSGGPNSGLQDPYVQAYGLRGCAPMKCFVDNIEAWSANEEAINWNAPLAWVAAFLDEYATRMR